MSKSIHLYTVRLLTVFAFYTFWTTTGKALSPHTGALLLRDCKVAIHQFDYPNTSFDVLTRSHGAACTAYLESFVDGMAMWQAVTRKTGSSQYPQVCIPPEVTFEQLARETIGYLQRNPSEMKENAWVVLAIGFNKRYPCAK